MSSAPQSGGTPGGPHPGPDRQRTPSWTFLTNHGHVLVAVARSADARVCDIAAEVGITPRSTLAILKDLEDAGYLRRVRVGRRSHYTLDSHQRFRHPATATHQVGELLDIFGAPGGPQATSSEPPMGIAPDG